MMARVTAILVCITILSAIMVVASQHRSRKLVTAIEKEQARTKALRVEWDQLLLENGAVGARQRVDKIARETLKMATPAKETQVTIEPVKDRVK